MERDACNVPPEGYQHRMSARQITRGIHLSWPRRELPGVFDPREFNGGNFMAKEEALLFIIQNAATMSL